MQHRVMMGRNLVVSNLVDPMSPTETVPHTAIAVSRRRVWLVRMALLGVMLALSVKIGDVLLGISLNTRERHELRLAPNTSWRHRSDEFDYEFRTNSLGFRGPEIPFDRTTAGVRRFLVVGDSFVAGHGVGEDDLFTAQWQRRLDESRGEGPRSEVINLGRTGTSTLGELRLYRAIGRRFRPDVVVLCLYLGNDLAEIVEEQTFKESAEWAPAGLPRNMAYRLAPNAYLELAMRRTATEMVRQTEGRTDDQILADVLQAAKARGVDESVARQRFQSLPDDVLKSARKGLFPPHRLLQACVDTDRTARSLDPDDVFFERAWPRMEDALGRFAASAETEGARFLLVVIPSSLQVSAEAQAFDRRLGFDVNDEWLTESCRTQRSIEAWAAANAVPILDFTPTLRQATEPCYFVRDGHFNATGHAVAARAIADFVANAASVGGRDD
ncbi:MAG: hypothetical protein IT428_30140 [Planctomycetaceae bacterium]|nr:hypothetical protein [Planctomycetaceae bacterium]